MTYILKNNHLKVEIAEPMELYRASRFDHAGNILQVTLGGKHTFCSSEKKVLSPIYGFGLMNEFDIDGPFGFNEAKAGEYFHKIGVGVLLKEEDLPYDFFRHYPQEPLNYSVLLKDSDQIQFSAKSKTIREMAYEYTKKISVSGNQLVIEYKLLNTGTVFFETTEYCHNFMAVNRRGIDAAYELKLKGSIQPDKFKESENLNILDIRQNEISWKSIPEGDFFVSGLINNEVCTGWSIGHDLEKVGVSESVDFKCYQMNLWGNAHVVSPELFHKIKLQPNQKHIWHRSYTFYNL